VLYADILREGGGPLNQFWKCTDPSFPEGLSRIWKKFTRRLSPYNWFTFYIEKKLYCGRTKITANSHFVRDLIMADYPHLRLEDIEVIYNRPDLSSYHKADEQERKAARARFGVLPQIKAIGYASSSFQRKGLLPLIRAIQLLPEDCHLYIASGSHSGAYSKFAESLGLAGRVHFVGRVDDMPVFYQALDLFILPTFCDACSNAVLEAAATGIPVISSRFDGSAYFLPKQNVLDDPNDSVSMAKSIKERLAEVNQSGAVWSETGLSGMGAWVELIERYIVNKNR
jgi:UDP-glucose:(heptosyl)LPS alpha-1,3-glucosyltransferase